MKNQWIKTTGMLVLAVIMLSGVDAQPRYGRGYGPGGQGYGPCGQGYGPYVRGGQNIGPGYGRMQPFALDLTEEQQEQMQTLRLAHYKVMKPLRNQMAELKARERTLLSEEEVDMKSIHKVIDNQTDLMNEMRKLQAEHRVAAREILTDEQVMQLDQRRKFTKRRSPGRNMG